MEKYCDNQSVGVILRHEDEILLIDRATPPYGLACVAGHIDEHGTPEQAVIAEVYEEVGIELPEGALTPLIAGVRVDLACRRIGGDHHMWHVFTADSPTKEVVRAEREVAGHRWVGSAALEQLIERSLATSPVTTPGQDLLEPVWARFLSDYLV